MVPPLTGLLRCCTARKMFTQQNRLPTFEQNYIEIVSLHNLQTSRIFIGPIGGSSKCKYMY